MNYITHTTGGVAMGLAAVSFLFPDITPTQIPISGTLIAGAAFGAVLPDIDHGKSYVSNKFPLIGCIIAGIFKHRGVLHTPVVNAVLVAVLIAVAKAFCPIDLKSYAYYMILGLGIGYLSHLLLDSLNVQGIMWLYPVSSKRFHILKITTGSVFEKVFAGFMVAVIVTIFPPEYFDFAKEYLR